MKYYENCLATVKSKVISNKIPTQCIDQLNWDVEEKIQKYKMTRTFQEINDLTSLIATEVD